MSRFSYRRPTLAAVLGAFTLLAFTPVCSAENLSQIYALAKENDPRIRAAKLEYDAVALGIDEARAGLLPTFAADYTKTNTKQNILSSDNAVFATGSSTYPQKDETLTITQPVFRLSAWRQVTEAKAAEREAAATYVAAQQDLILRTATAYLNVLAAQNALTLANAERDSIQSQLTLANNKYKSGQATIVNMRDAEARAALKESDLVLSQNDLDDKIQALREITGTTVKDLSPLIKDLPLTAPEPMDLGIWVQGSLDKNVLLESRTEAVQVARDEVSKQRAGYYPTVDLQYSTDRKTTGGSLFGGGSDVKETDLMLHLHVPIYEGGLTKTVTAVAARRYEEAEEDLERDKRMIERQARSAYQGVVGGIARVHALQTSVTSLESARMLKEEGFKAGLVTVLGVLDAERDLYAVQRDIAQARYDYLINTLKLKQAAGILSDDDLVRIGRLTQ